MYFKCSIRRHPETHAITGYYRLVESYRNSEGRVCHRTVLNVGFMEDTSAEQRERIQDGLNDKYAGLQRMFDPEKDALVREYVEALWIRILKEKRIDRNSLEKERGMIYSDTMKHNNARDIGAERMCYNEWERLGISGLFDTLGWNPEQIQLAATQVVSRAVYAASELKTSRWIKENSAICELTGYSADKITKDKLYRSALKLFEVKDELEKHLSKRTNELFSLQDKIILFDLTNTFFEGRKEDSEIAKFGRSKEKRSDAKLVVLALVVNIEGFIKYSAIHEGNIADSKTLSTMIDKLKKHTCPDKAVVVIDAGIATEDNLKLIREKGCEYLCVSRKKLKEYAFDPTRLTVMLETKSKQNVILKTIATEEETDYFLEVKSEAKVLKENAMGNQFERRFEQKLESIAKSIQTKGGTKKTEKVWERIGRAKEKYPSVHQYYKIEVSVDAAGTKATGLHWEKDALRQPKDNYGVYFLRTSLNIKDEVVIWNIYNTLKEIENSFRTLKTELDLRPIYHQTDKATMAHLHLGLLAYWIVNSIRHRLKCQGIHHQWNEIVRIGNTQKIITTNGQNKFGQTIEVRKSTEPEQKLKELLEILQMPVRPFRKRKSVVHKPTLKKIESPYLQVLPPS